MNYTYYLNNFKGQAIEADFSRLLIPAQAHINRLTNNRAKNATGADLEAVKLATCAVIDELIKQEHGGILASESNDGISRSYVTGSVVKTPEQRIYAAAKLYLSGTNQLYMGV